MAATQPAVPTNIAAALRYGPQTQSTLRRSQYLASALAALQAQGQQPIQGWGELGTKLLATAILNRAGKKADAAAVGALKSDQDAETQRLLAGLGKAPQVAPAPAPQPAPVAPAPPPTLAALPPPEPVQQAALPPAQPQYSPEDRDALTRMLATEAIGEGPEGMGAAGHVALNRLKSGYGGAKTLRDVVMAPHQFEGMSRAGQVKPEDYQRAAQVADAILTGQMPDPTGGAINFLNPDLQAQMGRAQPSWAPPGQGQRIGRHVFYGGQPHQQMATNSVPPPPPPPNSNGPPVQDVGVPPAAGGGAPPVQLAGPLQPGMIPSAPGSSPSDAGTPPAPQLPQAPGAGGNPAWPTFQPTQQQIDFVSELLHDPRTHDMGVAEYNKLRAKMAEPVEASIQLINGVPFYVSKTPGQGGAPVMIPVPKEAMTQVMGAQQAGLQGAPQGLNVQRDPLGNLKEAPGAPPQGFQTAPGGLAPIAGGPSDPMRPQAPQQGFQYAPGGVQAPIRGGPADPTSPMNLVTGEGKLRDDYEKQVAPYIAAREGYQKVVQAAGDPTQAGAIAMVFGYMKTLDPGSTVREGEQASVQNSGTIPQTITNLYNKLLAGKSSLSAEQRADFAASAKGQFEVYQRTFESANTRFGDLAKSYGYAPERVTRRFDAIPDFKPPKVPPPAAVAVYTRMRESGQLDLKQPFGSKAHPIIAGDAEALKRLDTPANRGKYVVTADGALVVID